jgi:CubicO group peptidase (beta-lactamase class C family)
MRCIILAFLACALATSGDRTFSTDRTDPAAAGMNSEMLARIHTRMQEFVDSGKTAGVVTLAARHGVVAWLDAAGFQDLERKIPMHTGTILNPCGNRVGHNCELVPPLRPMNVLDLMTHMSGLGDGGGRGGPIAQPASRTEMVASLASRATLLFQPGSAWNYSNFGISVLGQIIAVVSGEPYERFMAEKIFAPLGMKDSLFEVPTDKADRVATIYTTEDGKLKPLTRGARFGAAIPSPDSGLLTTASDLARFDQMMLNKGVLNGRRVLSAAAVEAMTVSYTGDMLAGYAAGVGQGFGFEVVTKPLGMYRYTSIGSFEKAGVYRTYIWVDPAKDLTGVILMQRNTGGAAADLADEVNVFMAMAAAAIEH